MSAFWAAATELLHRVVLAGKLLRFYRRLLASQTSAWRERARVRRVPVNAEARFRRYDDGTAAAEESVRAIIAALREVAGLMARLHGIDTAERQI